MTRPRASLQSYGYVEGIASLTASQSVPHWLLESRSVICGLIALTPHLVFAALPSAPVDPVGSRQRSRQVAPSPDERVRGVAALLHGCSCIAVEPRRSQLRSVASLCLADKGGCARGADVLSWCCTLLHGGPPPRAMRPVPGCREHMGCLPSKLRSHTIRVLITALPGQRFATPRQLLSWNTFNTPGQPYTMPHQRQQCTPHWLWWWSISFLDHQYVTPTVVAASGPTVLVHRFNAISYYGAAAPVAKCFSSASIACRTIPCSMVDRTCASCELRRTSSNSVHRIGSLVDYIALAPAVCYAVAAPVMDFIINVSSEGRTIGKEVSLVSRL